MWYEPVIGAILFGVITVLIGYVSGFLIKKLENSQIPAECADWNKNHVMEKSLFVTGALTWLLSYGFSKYPMSK
jgi:hypothetical protein